jgi:alkylation response protein AidB-like acyl-CoA dehydrogenase
MTKIAIKVLAAAAVLALVGGLAYAGLSSRREAASTANGTGLTYEGGFYWASGSEVAASSLGEPVATGVPFQDRTADLRAIDGFAPDTALAALLPPLTGGGGGLRWTFVSTDIHRGTNPTAYADSAAVLAGDD